MDLAHLQVIAFQVITGLTLAMPFLEWLVKQTKTDADDKALAFVEKALAMVPRVRLGDKK